MLVGLFVQTTAVVVMLVQKYIDCLPENLEIRGVI